jgi:hypothetical protein
MSHRIQEADHRGRLKGKGIDMAEERERLEAEEKDDTEGHRRAREDMSGDDDVEGHRKAREDITGDDDVEGHRKAR